jgi:hypothetical protein
VPLSEQEADLPMQANEQLFPAAVAMLPPNGSGWGICHCECTAWLEGQAIKIERQQIASLIGVSGEINEADSPPKPSGTEVWSDGVHHFSSFLRYGLF